MGRSCFDNPTILELYEEQPLDVKRFLASAAGAQGERSPGDPWRTHEGHTMDSLWYFS